MEEKLFELMTKMYGEMQQGFAEVKSEIKDINQRLTNVEETVTKNSIAIERIESNLSMVAEVQSSFQEQMERETQSIKADISSKYRLLELAVRKNKKSTDAEIDYIFKSIH